MASFKGIHDLSQPAKAAFGNGMPPRLLERIAGGGVKLDTGKEETA